jgi:hypothetical protein
MTPFGVTELAGALDLAIFHFNVLQFGAAALCERIRVPSKYRRWLPSNINIIAAQSIAESIG